MRGRSQKAAEPKTPRESLNSSTIQKYLKDVSTKSPGLDKKQTGTKEKKKELAKQKGETGENIRDDPEQLRVLERSMMEEQRNFALIPTKPEMLEMFSKLENSIKSEILNVRTDMGHLLQRVEEEEEASGIQAKEILDLKSQMKKMQSDYCTLLHKVEEQENQSRSQNLQIRSLPEQTNEDLTIKMKKIFNPILGRREEEVLKIDRVHRIRKPPNLRKEVPRDVIIKFHSYEEKEKIWRGLRGASPVCFENTELQIFSDLSAGTLAWRRQLRPLLDQLRKSNIKYSWGFPSSLGVMKEGRSIRLRPLENLQDFCEKLGIPVPDIPS